jgi:hypothetical protein
MIPIELPITMGATEPTAMGMKLCGGDGAGVPDTPGPGLMTALKESFAAIMAEVSGTQSTPGKEGPQRDLLQGALTEDAPDLPEALAALVAFFNSGQAQMPVCDNLVLKPTQGTGEADTDPTPEMMDKDAVAPSAVPETVGAGTEIPVIDLQVVKNKDQALERWLAVMGVTDSKIKARALERWLKLQQMPALNKVTSVKRFTLPLPGLEVRMQGFQAAMETSPLNTMVTLEVAKDMAKSSEPPTDTTALLSGGAPAGAGSSNAQPIGVWPETSEVLTTLAAPEGSASGAERVPAQENGASPSAELKDRIAPTVPLPNTPHPGSEAGAPPGSTPESLEAQQSGSDKDGSLPHFAKGTKAAVPHTAPLQGPVEVASQDEQGLFSQPVWEKDRPASLQQSLPAHGFMPMDERAGTSGGASEGQPNQEQIALGKAPTVGGEIKAGMPEKAAQSFMRQHAPEVMTQIVDKAVVTIKNDQKEMKLELKPEFLGQMRMRIVTENHQVSIRILTESPAVKQAIEGHLHQLKADLGSHGLQIDKVDVFVSADSYQHPDQRDNTPSFHGGGRMGREERQARERNERQAQDNRREHPSSAKPTGIDYFV